MGVPSLDILTEDACICTQNLIHAKWDVFPTMSEKPFPIERIPAADTSDAAHQP